MTRIVRVAAAGDIHASESLREHLVSSLAGLHEVADLFLIAGDLTTHGLPEQAEVLADACAVAEVPVYAVLGNHDYHSGRSEEVEGILRDAGVNVLCRGFAVCHLDELEVGIVGTKGFVGGFAGAELPDFGESLLRQVYAETGEETDALERGLEAVSGCHRRIVLLHYSPLTDTLVGEPESIWAFLGSSRLAAPIGAHRPDLVLHGHAHHGSAGGAIGSVPVLNVAVHLIGKPYVVVDI
jgi:uncharacterized protein